MTLRIRGLVAGLAVAAVCLAAIHSFAQQEGIGGSGGLLAPQPARKALSEAAQAQLLTRALSQDERLDFLKSFVAREKGAAVADALRSLDRPVTLTARNPYVAGRAYLSGNNVSWNPEHNLFLVLALPPEAERPNSIAVHIKPSHAPQAILLELGISGQAEFAEMKISVRGGRADTDVARVGFNRDTRRLNHAVLASSADWHVVTLEPTTPVELRSATITPAAR